ncbi:MAG: ATP-dependent ligase [Myxococcaceae bacterium]|nr:ATP-dependent ligase [Myxococcaceae bacterium]
MLLSSLARVSAAVGETRKRTEKVRLLAACFAGAGAVERGLAALYLSGAVRQSKLGVGWAQLKLVRETAAAHAETLTVADVDAVLGEVAASKGAGSAARRLLQLRALFARATANEQTFLARLIMGELRQGALESLVLDALAVAAEVPAQVLRRAQMLSGDLLEVARVSVEEGEAGLLAFDLRLFRPVVPMLAEPAVDVSEALSKLARGAETRAAFETKLDGARVQVHRQGDAVKVYTRALNEVTAAVPEVVALVQTFAAQELILDGEVIALREDGSPYPFQETMRRFGRRLDVATLQKERLLSTFFFDCLFVDGESLLSAPTDARIAALARVVPAECRVARIVTADAEEADAFFQSALDRGHEGVMAKELAAPYFAGSRGGSWLKLKQAHTLDLVVLAAEWGSGRRTGLLSNLHLGARDPDHGGFVMLGKTFKGLTDEMLREQTEQLLLRETRRDDYVVYVRPELVVEIAFNDVQTSPHYPGGMALRFARVKGYRPDKTASDADTIEQVRAIHARSVSPR